MLKILIVEDELIIAKDLSNMLTKMGYEVVGIAKNYAIAVTLLEDNLAELALIDINLKGEKDGVNVAEYINENKQIPFMFITSYSDKETLERVKKTNPSNYIVKPFKTEQLFTAIELAFINKHKNTASEIIEDSPVIIQNAIFIKDKYRYTKVSLDDILWIKSEGNYLEIYLENKKEIIRSSIDGFLSKLNDSKFFRTQKSYIINLDYISKIETNFVEVGGKEIPITKMYHTELLKKLNII